MSGQLPRLRFRAAALIGRRAGFCGAVLVTGRVGARSLMLGTGGSTGIKHFGSSGTAVACGRQSVMLCESPELGISLPELIQPMQDLEGWSPGLPQKKTKLQAFG